MRSQNLKFSVEFPDDDRESLGVTNYEVVKRRKDHGDGGQGTDVGGLAPDDRDQDSSGRDPGTASRAQVDDEATASRNTDISISGRNLPTGDGNTGSIQGTSRDRHNDERTGQSGHGSGDTTQTNDYHVQSGNEVARQLEQKEIKAVTTKVDDLEDGEFEWSLQPVQSKKVKETKTARHIKNERIVTDKKETNETIHQSTAKTVRQHKQQQKTDVAHIQAKSERNVYTTNTDAKTAPKTLTASESRPKGNGIHSIDVAERLYKKRKIWDKDQDYRIGEFN